MKVKKLVCLAMVMLFTVSFVAVVMVSKAEAVPPPEYYCIDGKFWICTWESYMVQGEEVWGYVCRRAGPC